MRSSKAAFQDCFKFERKLGNLGSEISAKNEIKMKKISKITVIVLSIITSAFHFSCGSAAESSASKKSKQTTNMDQKLEKITFGAGCFWCVEAVFQRVKGVKSVTSGYMGGKMKNPTYREVCSGLTGHAEVCQLSYDPKEVSVATLLENIKRFTKQKPLSVLLKKKQNCLDSQPHRLRMKVLQLLMTMRKKLGQLATLKV